MSGGGWWVVVVEEVVVEEAEATPSGMQQRLAPRRRYARDDAEASTHLLQNEARDRGPPEHPHDRKMGVRALLQVGL